MSVSKHQTQIGLEGLSSHFVALACGSLEMFPWFKCIADALGQQHCNQITVANQVSMLIS